MYAYVLSTFLADDRCSCSTGLLYHHSVAWWRHQKETFSALLAFCAGNSPVTGEFLSLATRSFDDFFDLRLNKQSRCRWFETPSRSLWRHCNECIHPIQGITTVWGILPKLNSIWKRTTSRLLIAYFPVVQSLWNDEHSTAVTHTFFIPTLFYEYNFKHTLLANTKSCLETYFE